MRTVLECGDQANAASPRSTGLISELREASSTGSGKKRIRRHTGRVWRSKQCCNCNELVRRQLGFLARLCSARLEQRWAAPPARRRPRGASGWRSWTLPRARSTTTIRPRRSRENARSLLFAFFFSLLPGVSRPVLPAFLRNEGGFALSRRQAARSTTTIRPRRSRQNS